MDNNTEKYGVELVTNYSKFSKDMENAGKLAEKLAERVEKTKQRIEQSTAKTSIRNIDDAEWNKSLRERQRQAEEYWNRMAKRPTGGAIFSQANLGTAELDLAKRKLTELVTEYARLNKEGVSKQDTQMLKLATDIAKAKRNVDKLSSSLSDADNQTNKFGRSVRNLKTNMNNTFHNGIKSIKRFGLSLFGIHSIWRMISRASSEALATNEYQTSRLSVTWNALGQILIPIIEKLITGFQYVAIFIAKVIQLLTGYNALAKTTTKNINETTNAVKNMSRALGGFDELTNLESSSGTGLASGLANDLNALAEFQKKVKEVEEWMQRSGIADAIGKIKKAVVILWQGALQPFWENVLSPMLNYLVEHPKALTTVFGVILGTKLITNIAKIMGVASAGTGLLGMHQVLLAIAGMGVITISLKTIREEVNKTNKAIEGVAKPGQKYYDTMDKLTEKSESAGATQEDVANQFNFLSNMMNTNLGYIDTMISGIEDLSFWDKVWQDTLLGTNSTLALNSEKIYKNSEQITENIRKMNKLEDANKLTEDQEKRWIKTLKLAIPRLEDQRDKLVKGSDAYNEMQNAIDIAKYSLKGFEDGTIKAKTPLENFTGRLFDGIKVFTDGSGKVNNFAQAIKNAVDTWKRSTFEEKTVKIKTAIETVVSGISNFANSIATTFKKALNNLGIGKLFSGLNSFDVGTNYVPNDQLAYVHKGEAIVPKEFNSAEFFGRTSNEEVVNAIRDLQATLEAKDMNAYISKKDIGQASIDYINQQNRIMGRSVL